jgi:hypothetical protein
VDGAIKSCGVVGGGRDWRRDAKEGEEAVMLVERMVLVTPVASHNWSLQKEQRQSRGMSRSSKKEMRIRRV